MEETTLKKWNHLTEEVAGPPVVIAALSCGRPEMMKMAPSKSSTVEETASLYNVIRVLMETNRELQKHSQNVATEMDQLRGTLRGLSRKFNSLFELANFTQPGQESDDD